MKKQLLTFLALFISGVISAQVGIGTTDPKSSFEVQGSMGYKVTTITSATTLTDDHHVILCNNGPYTVTLPPAAANASRVYRIKNIDAQSDVITIDGNGSETIDGDLTYALQPYKYSITLISDGANWQVIEFFTSGVSPTASAGGALSAICQSGTSAAMGGSVGGSATGGTWTGGAGIWTNATNPSTATYTAGVSESGSITLTLTTSGGSFGTTTATKSITVNATNTAGAASSTPTLCINTALTNITHTTTGATGISNNDVAGANGLPAGVKAVWASNTITISGTPTASGTFAYSIPLTGGCGSVNATGTITVTAANTAGAASSTPTLCINTALTNITHTTTGATGISNNDVAGANGLPAGVKAVWASNTITISGTPTASGTFNYSIPLTGGCGSVNATGTITVTAANTAGVASSTPTLCINTALTNITHTTTGATGISNNDVAGANGLPAGVKAVWASNTITISGTPTASGTFNYSIPLTGGCGSVNATGTITVTAANTAGAASSTPTLDINTALTDITHTTTGATGIGAATDLPAGVTAAWASNTITISGTPTEDGTFNYSIPLTGGCGTVNATGTITVNAAVNATCTGATISETPCSSVSGATINDNVSTTLGTEYNWTGATTSGMANTSTTQAIVDIGGQCWMRYNMNTTPSNFNPVPTWVNSTDVGWSGIYTGGSFENEGLLYQWSAAMNNSTTERAQGVCPTGWHIPSDCEWMYLENTLGMNTTDQQATSWRTSGDVDYDLSEAVPSGTNNSGFSGLLAGVRTIGGTFGSRTLRGYWWSSSATGANASYRHLHTGSRGVLRNSANKAGGYSVRCLKD